MGSTLGDVLLDRDEVDLERGRIRIRRLKGGLSESDLLAARP